MPILGFMYCHSTFFLKNRLYNLGIAMTDQTTKPLTKIKAFMEETLEKHGHTSLGVGWRSRENQFLRFDQFLPLFDQQKRDGVSLNDFGCALGGLYEWVKERKLPVSHYVGYDISDKMIADARALHLAGDATFVCGSSITETADYSIACGIFNTRLDESEENWNEYMRSVVKQLAGKSRFGFAFNSLTTYVDWRKDHLFYADPLVWFDWCKRNISPRVALLHDSTLYEWTMIVRL